MGEGYFLYGTSEGSLRLSGFVLHVKGGQQTVWILSIFCFFSVSWLGIEWDGMRGQIELGSHGGSPHCLPCPCPCLGRFFFFPLLTWPFSAPVPTRDTLTLALRLSITHCPHSTWLLKNSFSCHLTSSGWLA